MKVLLLVPIRAAAGGIHNWAKLLLQEVRDPAIEYVVVDTSVRYRTLGGKMGPKEAIFATWDSAVRLFSMTWHLYKDRPKIVYFTNSPSIGFAFRDTVLIVLSKLFRRRVVIHLRGGNVQGFWGGNYLRKTLAGLGSRLSDYIFVITRECESFARQHFGSQKVIFVPNFINTDVLDGLERFVPPEIDKNRFNVIHVGIQCQQKGTFEIIEAGKFLDEDINILLIGPVARDVKIAIEKAISVHNVANRVQLVGPKSKPELWSYFQFADLFLFPTHMAGPEGFPNVILEAMLCELPIIATDVGNIVEMIGAGSDRTAGIILKESDAPNPKEIADMVIKLKNNRAQRDDLGKSGYLIVTSNYAMQVVVPALEQILHAINENDDVLKVAKEYFVQKEFVGEMRRRG